VTGPEHYAEAERLLGPAMTSSGSFTLPKAPDVIATAQVHATLALAAAMVDGPMIMRPEDRDEWDRATGRLEVTP
jgi:hypothetical protein